MNDDLSGLIIGRSLDAIFYEVFDWDRLKYDKPVAIDEIPFAVVMSFESLHVLFRWDLRPPIEQLAVELAESCTRPTSRELIDVSNRWPDHIGQKLVSVSQAHQSNGEGIEPWAVTLSFSAEQMLLIALGELKDGLPAYIPDSLVVTASRQVGRMYQPLSALSPAFTGDVFY